MLARIRGMVAVSAMALAALMSPHLCAQRPFVITAPPGSPVPLDGQWSFHRGDLQSWFDPAFDDSNSELIAANAPWGAQGFSGYHGYAWYRLHIVVSPAAAGAPLAILIPHIDDAYDIYWNGTLIGRNGRLPPFPLWHLASQRAQIYALGPAQSGVLAIRVWKSPPLSDDDGMGGGFASTPLLGSPQALEMHRDLLDYRWLSSRQFTFALNLLYALVGLLSLLAWTREREQWPLFWIAGFALSRVAQFLIFGIRMPWYIPIANVISQPLSSLRDISLWFLLLWLLDLRSNRRLVRLTHIAAWVSLAANILDGLPVWLGWIPQLELPMQVADALFTALYILTSMLPLVLVLGAVPHRSRLDTNRWAVAFFAFLAGMMQVAAGIAPQGRRFTHWTLADFIDAPLFTIAGNSVTLITATGILLLVAIVYAVYRNARDNRRRQALLEQEFQSARALQHVLIPDTLPALPGIALTSAYQPAQEVGGDFFQIIPLEDGATLIILGDVSGKGLRAAMSVSYIVGVVRTLAGFATGPADLLTQLNRRLCDRLQGGFATCLVLWLDANHRATFASAGHPAPFFNQAEISLPGALPLGIAEQAHFEQCTVPLRVGDHCTIYTDGLLEARSASGELFGFDRITQLLSARPNAVDCVQAAINFGQDDDITVLTLTRVLDEQSSTLLSAPLEAIDPSRLSSASGRFPQAGFVSGQYPSGTHSPR